MVSPAKTAAQVNAESLEGKELYKVSHNDFDVGMLRDVCSSLRTDLKLVRSIGNFFLISLNILVTHLLDNVIDIIRRSYTVITSGSNRVNSPSRVVKFPTLKMISFIFHR